MARSRPRLVPGLDLDARYAICRSHGHSWVHVGRATEADRVPTSAPVVLGWVSSCSNCGMRRIRWLSSSGQMAAPARYERPEGYSRHGEERLSITEWRQLWLRAEGVELPRKRSAS